METIGAEIQALTSKIGVARSLPNRQAQRLRYDRLEKIATVQSRLAKNIPSIFRNARLGHISTELKNKLFKFNPKIGAVLFGPAGRGKSYLLAALMRDYIISHVPVKRITYERLCLDIRSTYAPASPRTENDIIKPLISCDVLIVEDVGTTTSINNSETDFSVRTFYVILNTRLENQLPTFLSTNKSKENLAKSFDDRIASRLESFLWVGVGGVDRRKK